MISFDNDGKSQLVASQPGAKWSFPPGLALQKHSPDLVSKPDINIIHPVQYKNQNAINKCIQGIWIPNQPIKSVKNMFLPDFFALSELITNLVPEPVINISLD